VLVQIYRKDGAEELLKLGAGLRPMNGKLVLELRHVSLAIISVCIFYSLTILETVAGRN
jgi:hypothetical protein